MTDIDQNDLIEAQKAAQSQPPTVQAPQPAPQQAAQPTQQPNPQPVSETQIPSEAAPKQTPPAQPHPQGSPVQTVNFKVEEVSDPNIVSDALTPKIEIAQMNVDRELYRIKSFPLLDLFPNELIIREKSLHVIQRNFMQSQVETMMVQDISFVAVAQGLFFATLTVSYRIPHDDFQITNVPKSEAMQAKAILDSLMIAKQNKGDRVEILEEGAAVAQTPITA